MPAKPPKSARKFRVGQRAWLHTAEGGTPRWVACTVLEVNPRSYVFREEDRWPRDRKVNTADAERRYLVEGEKLDRDWRTDHRRAILREIEKADVVTLQVVAKAIGYEAKEVLDGFGW